MLRRVVFLLAQAKNSFVCHEKLSTHEPDQFLVKYSNTALLRGADRGFHPQQTASDLGLYKAELAVFGKEVC